MMKAIVHQNGRPVLCTVPKPKRFCDTDLLLHVLQAGLCRTDVYAGFGQIPTKNNRILGHEFVATVTESSSNSSFSIGDRVAVFPKIPCQNCFSCLDGAFLDCHQPSFLGIDRDGCFAEYIVVPEIACYKIPPSLSLKRAAYVEPVAAALAMFETDIRPEQSGLLLGSGRIANLCLNLLRYKGFNAVLKANTPPINQRFDFVIECNQENISLQQMLNSLSEGGLLVLKSRSVSQNTIDVSNIVKRSLRIQGAYYGSFLEAIDLLNDQAFQVEQYFGATHPLPSFLSLFQSNEDVKLFCDPNDVCAE